MCVLKLGFSFAVVTCGRENPIGAVCSAGKKMGIIGLPIVLVLHGLFRGEEKQFVKAFRSDLLLVCSCA